MKRFNINMSDELYQWYSNNSNKAGTTMSSMITTILHQYKEGQFTVTNEVINAGIQKIENIIVKSQPRGKQTTRPPHPGREQMAMRSGAINTVSCSTEKEG